VTDTKLPDRGVVFWPVATGDSTTIVVDDRFVMQVDLRDMDAADEDDAVVAPVIDRLQETLPRLDDGTPYLAVFALTHADLDHCSGFGDLLDSDIVIGELWATPRLWRELADDEELCEDAQRFHGEADRRVSATLAAVADGREPDSGDRIRIIGYDEDRDDHPYADLPDEYFTTPGEAITMLDGEEISRLRIGWALVPPALRERMIIVKEAADLSSSNFAQAMALSLLRRVPLAPDAEGAAFGYSPVQMTPFGAISS
jgi:hypothetical protein